MATAVIRNMTLGQNMHHQMVQNNCVLVSSVSSTQTPVIMQHHLHHHNGGGGGGGGVGIGCGNSNTNNYHLGKRPIAPATESRSMIGNGVMSTLDQNRLINITNNNNNNINSKNKKLAYSHMTQYGGAHQPASVQRRNARERNRVKQVNNGFANLREHIPPDVIQALTNGGRGASKKLSKVDTLKLAVEYIRRLQDLLDENENDINSSSGTILSSSSTSSSSSSGASSSGGSSFYAASPMQTTSSIPPTCSEASASPTPSYSSEVSTTGMPTYAQTQPPYKYEIYDTYNPEDEELLDCITWWQQQ